MYEYDPTMNPGLGSPRCLRCLSPLNHSKEKGEWTITLVLHDATAVAGSGIGGLLSAIHGIPYVQKHVKGSKWLPLIIGLPPFLTYSAASATFGGFVLPQFTQLSVTSYYAASSASSSCISLLTRQKEDAHTCHFGTKDYDDSSFMVCDFDGCRCTLRLVVVLMCHWMHRLVDFGNGVSC